MTDNSTTLLDLAARCEAATGPDRELDALIACHAPICQADYVLSAVPSRKRGMVTRYFDGGWHGTFVCENYTASLDAAMTLVEPPSDQWGEYVSIGLWDSNGVYPEHVRATAWVRGAARAYAATMPLALCAAALKARAAQ